MSGARVVVVCALEFERRRLAGRLRGRGEVVCCGPGAGRAAACVEGLASRGVERVILAGVCGGLRATPVCPPIARVVDREGNEWDAAWVGRGGDGGGVTLLGVDGVVGSAEEKGALASAHDADLVDCESHGFAAAASRLGLTWGVVRGVSDGPGEALDRRVERWTDGAGRTRGGRVVADLVRRPGLIGGVVRLGRRASAAMGEVCDVVDGMVRGVERVGDG